METPNTKAFFPASSFKGLADEEKEGEESNAKSAAAFFYYISDIFSHFQLDFVVFSRAPSAKE